MKIPTSIWKWQNKRLSIMKIMVLLWSTSVVKRIVTLSLLSFSLIFFFLGLFSFFIAFLFLFLTWDNALIMMIITLLFIYNSMITTRYYKKVWLYMNASGGVPGYAMNQEWHVWKNYERWLCHKYYVNYMIMPSNMTMMNVSWWTEWWKVAWQYISEWLWKCHNR